MRIPDILYLFCGILAIFAVTHLHPGEYDTAAWEIGTVILVGGATAALDWLSR